MFDKVVSPTITTSGINEQNIEKLKLDITDYAERINGIFQNMSTLVEESKIYFDCESGTAFRAHFASLEENFKVVNQNILSYADDMAKVQLHYRKKIEDLVNGLKSAKNVMTDKATLHQAYVEKEEEK